MERRELVGAGLKGPPDSGAVGALASLGTDLYAFGGFTNAGGITARGLARWNGANWSTLRYGVDNTVVTIETTPTDVYVGGSFTNAYNFPRQGYTVNRIARWDDATGW